jgi:hypothetical protein
VLASESLGLIACSTRVADDSMRLCIAEQCLVRAWIVVVMGDVSVTIIKR